MADVRSLLRNERAARRISHPQATYSTTGTLVCLVCHIQLKSESLWEGHLRSAQHAMRLQRIRDGTLGRPPGAPAPKPQRDTPETEDDDGTTTPPEEQQPTINGSNGIQGKKRKAEDRDDNGVEKEDRKRSKSTALPKGFFDDGVPRELDEVVASHDTSAQRSVTTDGEQKNGSTAVQASTVDEDEWAAFEADIAATEAPVAGDAVISAPAVSAEELAAKAREEESEQKKERGEVEVEGDKEDAARKLEEEFEEMHELEEKVKKLKEKREAIRAKRVVDDIQPPAREPEVLDSKIGKPETEEDEDEDDYDDDDNWDGFRLKA